MAGIRIDDNEKNTINFDNKIIFMSTCSVYGHSNNILKESSRKKPLSLYAKTKIDAEKIKVQKF